MANIKATQQWAQAKVLIAPTGTVVPKDLTSDWDPAWKTVGLLDGEAGIVKSRSQDRTEKFAWGGTMYRSVVGKQKTTWKFTALENNDVVFKLVNPGSTRETNRGVTTAVVKEFQAGHRFMAAIEVIDPAYGKTRREVATIAEVAEVGDLKDAESDTTVYEITLDLIKDPATGAVTTIIETSVE